MERMLSEDDLTSALSPAYLANYTGTIDYITSKGAYAIVDPHNFGRFYGAIIEDTADFQTFCTCCRCHLVSSQLDLYKGFSHSDTALAF